MHKVTKHTFHFLANQWQFKYLMSKLKVYEYPFMLTLQLKMIHLDEGGSIILSN